MPNVLTIDFSRGAFNVGSISYVGGKLPGIPSNALNIVGGSYDVVTCNYRSPHDGTVQLGTGGTIVSYANLTPITIGVIVFDLVLVLPNGTVGGSLQDDGTAGNNTVRLVTTNASFEDTT